MPTRRTGNVAPSGVGQARPVQLLAGFLVPAADALGDALAETVLIAEPVYRERYTDAEVRSSCRGNVAMMLDALAAGRRSITSDLPMTTARRNAEEGVPLEAVLHAYRACARIVWDGLVEAAHRQHPPVTDGLLAGAAEVWDLMDRVSAHVAESYRSTEADLARRDAELRQSLIDAVLAGRGADATVSAQASDLVGYGDDQSVTVVVAQAVDGQHSVTHVERALRGIGIRSVWRLSAGAFVGVVVHDACASAEIGEVAALGFDRIGVSPSSANLADVPQLRLLADIARRAAPVGGVARLDDHLPEALLAARADLARRLVDKVLGDTAAWRSRQDRRVLVSTFNAWCETGGDIARTAGALFVHRNTVHKRLRRLEALSGCRLAYPAEVVRLWLAVNALRLAEADAE